MMFASGCASVVTRCYSSWRNDFYPALQADVEGIKDKDCPVRYKLGLGIIDAPISLCTDTILLPADTYRYFKYCREPQSYETYVGDGEFRYVNKSSWDWSEPFYVVRFADFPLSTQYHHTYSFTGLSPISDRLNEYELRLVVPPSVHKSEIDSASLELVLFGNGKKIAISKARVRELNCDDFKDFNYQSEEGDGLDKEYTSQVFKIPADPTIKYKLEILYTPPRSLKTESTGHIYLRLGGHGE